MIKKATGDWQRRIPPWAATHTCDLRRYRGPYSHVGDEIARKRRALDRLAAAFEVALSDGAEFLIVRCGARVPRSDALQRLLREYLCAPQFAASADVGESRDYPDRIVVALAPNSRRKRSRGSRSD